MKHIVICDDEKRFRMQLKLYLDKLSEKTGEEFQVTCFSSGSELLSNFPPDTSILLLDIEMGEISGMDVAHRLRKTLPNLCIIFITSHVGYALEGYQVHAFGFLCKPVQFGQFYQQMKDALSLATRHQGKVVTFKLQREAYQINSNDIFYITVYKHKVSVVLKTGEIREFSDNLNVLEKSLSEHGFFRCHNSILVNLSAVTKIGQNELEIQNGDVIPLSRHRRKDFLAAFSKYAEVGL